MLLAMLSLPIFIAVLGVGILLFGATRLPQVARNIGRVRADFIEGTRGPDDPTPPHPQNEQ